MADLPDQEFKDALDGSSREMEAAVEPEQARAYVEALAALNRAAIPYLVAGAFAEHAYTGVWRKTKDLDLFIKPEDLKRALDVLAHAGFETEIVFKHWLAKARQKSHFVDLIFGVGTGQLRIDDSWIERARTANILGITAPLMPPEEVLVSKVYVAERNRFDGPEIMHLIERRKGRFNWLRVLELLGEHRGLLLWHLILFNLVYPGRTDYLPKELMLQLFDELRQTWTEPVNPRAFRGILLDPFSYTVDIEDWGYEDGRDLEPIVDEEGEMV